MRTIHAAVFDMDGLLFDTEKLFMDIGLEASAMMGRPVPLSVFHRCIGLNNEDSRLVLLEVMGPSFDYEEFRGNWRRLRDTYIIAIGVPMKPGVHGILDRVSGFGLPAALATSSRKETAAFYLNRSGLADRFSVVVGGDEVTAGKPAPDLFFRAASLLGVEPERCIVFEDSIHGAKGGLAAGMRVVIVPDLIDPPADLKREVFAVCESLTEASSRLEDFLA